MRLKTYLNCKNDPVRLYRDHFYFPLFYGTKMLMWIIILSASMTLAACVVLLRRAHDLQQSARKLLADASADVKQAVETIVKYRIQHGMLLYGTANGFSSLQISYREPQDPYDNCQQLLIQIGAASYSEKIRDVLNLSRMLYQFAYSLHSLTDETIKSIDLVEQRLMQGADAVSIDRLERVILGAPLDHRTMISMNYGTHVEAALSPIVYKKDGKVLHKAKVFCK